MAKYRIEHERELCIGCKQCATVCPDNWFIAEDGKSKPKKTELDDLGCNVDAANSCPSQCIRIVSL